MPFSYLLSRWLLHPTVEMVMMKSKPNLGWFCLLRNSSPKGMRDTWNSHNMDVLVPALSWWLSKLPLEGPAEEISFSRDLGKTKTWDLGKNQSVEKWLLQPEPVSHLSQARLLHLQGYFIRVTEQNWWFFLFFFLVNAISGYHGAQSCSPTPGTEEHDHRQDPSRTFWGR